MKNARKQLLHLMQIIEERAEMNPKGVVFFMGTDLFVDCPDYEPLMEKLDQEYKAITIKQRPDERSFNHDELAAIDADLSDYYSYKVLLTSAFEPLLQELSIGDSMQDKARFMTVPDVTLRSMMFDAKSSELVLGNKRCKIPYGTLEYFVCKLVFKSRRLGVKEQDVIDAYDSNNSSQRPVYDALIRINKRALLAFGVEKLLTYKQAEVRVNKKYL